LQCDLPAWMTTGNSCSASDDFHRITDEAIRSVMQTESHLEVRHRGHAVLRQLFLNGAKECTVCRAIFFGIPPKSPYPQGRAKTAAQLFILPEHLQATLQPEHHDRQPRFLNLLFEPIRNIVWDIRLPDIHEVLELVQRQQTDAAALEQFPEANAFAHGVAA